jgi:hypothetical protein
MGSHSAERHGVEFVLRTAMASFPSAIVAVGTSERADS